MKILVNGEEVFETEDSVYSVSLRSNRGEAGKRYVNAVEDGDFDIVLLLDKENEDEVAISVAKAVVVEQQISVANGAEVTMDGTPSLGKELTYAWTRISGPTTPSLSGDDEAVCTWTSHESTDGTYVYELEVTDADENTDTTIVAVTVA